MKKILQILFLSLCVATPWVAKAQGSTIDISNPGITSGTGWSYNAALKTYVISGHGVTIEGTVTGASDIIFYIDYGVTATWNASISGNPTERLVTLVGGGTLIVAGGNITHTGSQDTNEAIRISDDVTLSVTGGTVSSSGGAAIRYYEGNTVNVSGGSVQNTGSYIAIVNNSGGGMVHISGGTVSGKGREAINTYGAVSVTGGLVYATNNHLPAIAIFDSGTISVSGGAVFSYGTAVNNVIEDLGISGPFTAPTGDGIVIAWDDDQILPISYTSGTTADLVVSPVGFAQWDYDTQGIKYAKGATNGSISIEGVSVLAGVSDVLITAAPIGGITSPVTGATPATAISPALSYTGSVAWSPNDHPFEGSTVYTATITLTAESGYTFSGGFGNTGAISGFTVNGIAPVWISNSGTQLVFSVAFPATSSTLTLAVSAGLTATAPVGGATPSTTITTGSTEFSAALLWDGTPATFAYETVYTATVTLTAAAGYTFDLSGEYGNTSAIAGFTVNGIAPATWVSNDGTTLEFKVTFPKTGLVPPTLITAAGLTATAPVAGATPATTISTGSTAFTAALSWDGTPATFAYETVYTATITLSAAAGYTFQISGDYGNTSAIAGFTVNDIAPTTWISNNGYTLAFGVTFPQTAPLSPIIDLNDTGTTSGAGWTYAPATQTYTITDDGVTITGNVTGATDTRTFDIAAGKTATWTAIVTGGFSDPLITLDGGGTLVVADGSITKTNASNAFRIDGDGATLHITGGTISSSGANAVYAHGDENTVHISDNGKVQSSGSGAAINMESGGTAGGTVLISGGTVTSDNGFSIYMYSSGTVNVSGGTVESATGNAIRTPNGSISQVSITGGTITSGGADYTIYVAQTGSTVSVGGGSVWATGSGGAINAVNTGIDVTVTGGLISATTGFAIESAGAVSVSGGTVFAYGTYNDVIKSSPNFVDPAYPSDGIVLAWASKPSPTYYSGTREDLDMHPKDVAKWDIDTQGIIYAKGDNEGVIVIAGVTVLGPLTLVTAGPVGGVDTPVAGETPVSVVTPTSQYTGTVTWSPDHNPFGYLTLYTATITLTAKSGYTFETDFGQTAEITGFTVNGIAPTWVGNTGVTLVFSVPFWATEIDPIDLDNADISTAISIVEGATYTGVQATIGNIAAAKARVEAIIAGLWLHGATAEVVNGIFTPATAETDLLPGIDGSYTFTVTLSKGVGTPQTTTTLTLTITASPYNPTPPPPVPVFDNLNDEYTYTPGLTIPLSVIGEGSYLLEKYKIDGNDAPSATFTPPAPGTYLIEALSPDESLRIWKHVKIL